MATFVPALPPVNGDAPVSVAPRASQGGTVEPYPVPQPIAGPSVTIWGAIVGALANQSDLAAALAAKASTAALNGHIADAANPHAVTKTQVGLGLADNTADASKPVSAAQASAIAAAVTGPLPGATITASQISDAVTDPGRQVLTAANDAAARAALGSGAVGDALFTAATVAAAETALLLSPQPTLRNKLHNAAMVFNERGLGSLSAVSAFLVDRWSGFNNFTSNPGRVSYQQDTAVFPPGFRSSIKMTVTAAGAPAAGDYYGFQQGIEGLSVVDLAMGTASAKALAFSLWVRCSIAGAVFPVSVRNAGSIPGGRYWTSTFTVNAANTWERKTFTIPPETTGTWNNDTNMCILVSVFPAVGANNSTANLNAWQSTAGNTLFGYNSQTQLTNTNGATFHMTGVQLEEGPVATPFEYVPTSVEFDNCRRYWQTHGLDMIGVWRSSNPSPALNGARFRVGLPVPMRNAPIVTLRATSFNIEYWSQVNFAISGATVSNVNVNSQSIDVDVLGTTAAGTPTAGTPAYITTNIFELNAEF